MLSEEQDDLQKEARKLQNEIDQKMLSFASVLSQLSPKEVSGAADICDTMAKEIEHLIQRVYYYKIC